MSENLSYARDSDERRRIIHIPYVLSAAARYIIDNDIPPIVSLFCTHYLNAISIVCDMYPR